MGFGLLFNVIDIFVDVIDKIAWFGIFPAIGGIVAGSLRDKFWDRKNI